MIDLLQRDVGLRVSDPVVRREHHVAPDAAAVLPDGDRMKRRLPIHDVQRGVKVVQQD